MYNVIIHPLRVHLHLSLVEYCVLDSVYHLQNKKKYDFWCVASHQKIADNIGVSPSTVKRSCVTLYERGYIEHGGVYKGKTKRVRVVESVCDLFNHHKQVKGIFYDDEGSMKRPQPAVGKDDRPRSKIGQHDLGQSDLGQNDLGTEVKMTHDLGQNDLQYIYNINNDINISPKGDSETGSHGTTREEKKVYGNENINTMLSVLKTVVECDDFRESNKQQRVWGNNLVRLKEKVGVKEFKRRLTEILSDDFKRGNSASLKYLYKEIKSFINPN